MSIKTNEEFINDFIQWGSPLKQIWLMEAVNRYADQLTKDEAETLRQMEGTMIHGPAWLLCAQQWRAAYKKNYEPSEEQAKINKEAAQTMAEKAMLHDADEGPHGWIIREDGTIERVEPDDGKTFRLDQMQEIVGGLIQPRPTKDGRTIVMNEEGKMINRPEDHINDKATALYKYGDQDPVVGDVLICANDLIK